MSVQRSREDTSWTHRAGTTEIEAGRHRMASRFFHLKHSLFDLAVRSHPQLELHHITAGGRADQPSPHIRIVLVECADIARRLVVINDVLVVCSAREPQSVTTDCSGEDGEHGEVRRGGGGFRRQAPRRQTTPLRGVSKLF
eukprot:scaffold300556_cov33-Tisochrysis_lutea.AAC.1